MIGIDVDPAKIISQYVVSEENACVPSSFLNALRFGPPSFQETFMALPGVSDAEKLRSLIDLRGSAPSDVARGRNLFDGGVQMDDIASYFDSLLASSVDHLVSRHFDIAVHETPAAHLRRIHSFLKSSLLQRVPIVAIVRAFSATEFKGKEFRWMGIAQHAILIVSVSAGIAPYANGFVCQFVEPSVGELCESYVNSETVRDFQAIKTSGPGFVYSETAKAFVPMKGLDDRWIDNGFLHLISPSLRLGTNHVPWYARTFMTLSHGLGKFNPEENRGTGGAIEKTKEPGEARYQNRNDVNREASQGRES